MKLKEITEFGYTGWLLPDNERSKLLALFNPNYPDVIAHHITDKSGVKSNWPLPVETTGIVVGIADNGESLQALVVSINGSVNRPDGSFYHITWSLDRSNGMKPVMSNDLLKQGWDSVPPISISITPTFFPI
jgi:hypothetical protein